VVQVDPGPELVGEAEPVGVSQGGQIVEVIRGWRVVVRHPQIEGQLGQPAQRLGRDPRQQGHRRFDAHGRQPALT
jgi:hypothetical protein